MAVIAMTLKTCFCTDGFGTDKSEEPKEGDVRNKLEEETEQAVQGNL